MKQATLIEPGRIKIQDVPVPEPSNGEVVIGINTALTCGTDLKAYIRGHNLIPMPGPFGHEYSGTVAKAGKGVTGIKEGDRVMGVHSAPCLKCGYCKRGFHNLCESIMDKKALGSFSEYLLLPSHVVKQNLFHKPDVISFEMAALLEPLSCVVHPYSGFNLDKTVTALVIGAGPIGLMHMAFLKKEGIKVIVCDVSGDRLAIAGKMGAEWTSVPDELRAMIDNITDCTGVDLVVECTGQKTVWEGCIAYLRRGGTAILFGGCAAGTSVCYDSHRLHYDELTVLGSFHYTPGDVQTAFSALTERLIDLSMLISGEFPLKDIEKAFSLLAEGKGIKYALKP